MGLFHRADMFHKNYENSFFKDMLKMKEAIGETLSK
jgi:hypothetical protein